MILVIINETLFDASRGFVCWIPTSEDGGMGSLHDPVPEKSRASRDDSERSEGDPHH